MLGIGLSLTGRLRSSVSIFSPVSLFSSNEPGIWLDPSDVANLAWRRNLLTFTEQFDNAVWGRVNATSTNPSVSANQGIAPDGTMTADLVTFGVIDAAGDASIIRQISGSQTNTQQTGSVYLKAANSFQVGKRVYVYLNDVVAINAFTPVVLSLDWQRVSVTGSYTGNDRYLSLATSGSGNFDGLGSNTDRDAAVLIWGAQLELGSVATDYQRISDVNTEVIERFPSATLYQDTAGTTPVTTPGQTVALALDKSKGLVLGSELVDTANTVAAWAAYGTNTVAQDGSAVRVTFVDNANGAFLEMRAAGGLSSDLIVGNVYRLTFQVRVNTGSVDVQSSLNGSFSNIATVSSTSNATVFISTVVTSTSNNCFLRFAGMGSGEIVWISNISVKELPGFHATQATLASRPTFQVEYNGTGPLGTELITNGDFSSGTTGWTAASGATIAVTSGQLAVTVASGGTNRRAYQAFSAKVGATYRVQGQVISNGRIGVGTSIVATETVLVGGSIDQVFVATASTMYIGLSVATVTLGDTATFDNISVKELPAESWRPYLRFDGVDDFLITPTITPGIDKAQVFAGVRKLSDVALSASSANLIIESSTGRQSNSGTIFLTGAIGFSTNVRYGFESRGTVTAAANSTDAAYAAPITNVLSVLGDIAGDRSTLRINGAQVTQTTTDQGAGNYLAYPIYIGRSGGTQWPLHGNIFSLIVRFGTNLDAGTITSTETWVAGKTGVTL